MWPFLARRGLPAEMKCALIADPSLHKTISSEIEVFEKKWQCEMQDSTNPKILRATETVRHMIQDIKRTLCKGHKKP